MRRVANQASKRTTPSPVFGMRFLTEEELKFAVVGCVGSPTMLEEEASVTIRLCGDGGDTDLEPAWRILEGDRSIDILGGLLLDIRDSNLQMRVRRWEKYLFVDEAHLHKNLWRHTQMARIAGLPLSNSQRGESDGPATIEPPIRTYPGSRMTAP